MSSLSFKLTASFVALGATALMACTAAPESDSVEADIDTDGVSATACRIGQICTPTKSSGAYLPPGGGTVATNDPVQDPGGSGITCTGPSPEHPGVSWYRVILRNGVYECLSVEALPAVLGQIPNGYSILSSYSCPYSYPVLHCDVYNRCTCWSW